MSYYRRSLALLVIHVLLTWLCIPLCTFWFRPILWHCKLFEIQRSEFDARLLYRELSHSGKWPGACFACSCLWDCLSCLSFVLSCYRFAHLQIQMFPWQQISLEPYYTRSFHWTCFLSYPIIILSWFIRLARRCSASLGFLLINGCCTCLK